MSKQQGFTLKKYRMMVNAKQKRSLKSLSAYYVLGAVSQKIHNHIKVGNCLSFDHLKWFYADFVSNSPKIGLLHGDQPDASTGKPRTNFHFLPNFG